MRAVFRVIKYISTWKGMSDSHVHVYLGVRMVVMENDVIVNKLVDVIVNKLVDVGDLSPQFQSREWSRAPLQLGTGMEE